MKAGFAVPHDGEALGGLAALRGKAFAPSRRPFVESAGIAEKRPHPSSLSGAGGGVAQAAERQREVDAVRSHAVEQVLGEERIVRFASKQSQLAPKTGRESLFEQRHKGSERRLSNLHSGVRVFRKKRQQRLGEAGQVPLRDARLVAIGVAATMVDRAVDRFG